MSRTQILGLTALSMLAFAGNGLLCRMALRHTGIDATSFTSIRIFSGALVLWLIIGMRGERIATAGSWPSALALFAYAVGVSFAYVTLPAAAGSLLHFGAVQATMIGYGLWRGEQLHRRQVAGLIIAFSGLLGLLLPGMSAPPLHGSILMLVAGIAWGIYCLRAKGATNPVRVTAGNFMRAVPFVAGLSIAMLPSVRLDGSGILYAIASGALASGAGYAIWYTALGGLKATNAATVQLSVPVIAALGGIAFLGEPVTLRLLVTSLAILGGIALAISTRSMPGDGDSP